VSKPYTGTRLLLIWHKDDLGDGHLLEELADWIESYIQTTEAHSLQWWDMVEGDRDFWDELPSLVEALMHRRYIAGLAACFAL